MVGVEDDRQAVPGIADRLAYMERNQIMGDKGGKKDKNKTQKQKAVKQEQHTQEKLEKQPKRNPSAK